MDPVAILNDSLQIARRLLRQLDGHDGLGLLEQDASELAAHTLALDEWRRKGGFDPYTADAHGGESPVMDSMSAFAQMLAETRFNEDADGAGVTDEQLTEIARIAPDDELIDVAKRASQHARSRTHALAPSAITYIRGFGHGVLAKTVDVRRQQDFPQVRPGHDRE